MAHLFLVPFELPLGFDADLEGAFVSWLSSFSVIFEDSFTPNKTQALS